MSSVFAEPAEQYEQIRKEFTEKLEFLTDPWRQKFQCANKPEFFAYKAGNYSDGVCLIERINLPDGRIVIVCVETAGNPGNSISNCAEELVFQVCRRFEIPAERLVWLEHYDGDDEWGMVTFARRPPNGPFEQPHWTKMTPEMWSGLRLRPLKQSALTPDPILRSHLQSKIKKLFPWPDDALD